MKVNAKEVIGFVSDKMGISQDQAQEVLCITDKETVISIQPGKGRYKHVLEHDLNTAKVDVNGIAETLGIPESNLETYVEDGIIWIVHGSMPEGIVGKGPTLNLLPPIFTANGTSRRWPDKYGRDSNSE